MTTPADVLTAYAAAIDALDVDALLALYEPDARILDAFAWQVDDWPARVRGWLGSMSQSNGTRVEDVQVIETADLAALSANVLYAGRDQDGNDHTIWNRLTWALRRHDDTWLVAQEHTSVPLTMENSQPDFRPVD